MHDAVQWHALKETEVANRLGTDLDRGLNDSEAQRRLRSDGPNSLPESPTPSALSLFSSQFANLIIWVLLGAAIISGLLGEWIDTVAILAIVLLNGVLGFAQEYKAERSLAALNRMSIIMARAVRDGREHVIPAADLVRGDVITIEAGDHVPADARLVYAVALRTHEASLTGESVPVDKDTAGTAPDTPLADRRGMVFLGTSVVAGKGRALVVETGARSELGRIAELIQAGGREPTPLQLRLVQFGKVLLGLSMAVVVMVFVAGLLRGEPLVDMFMTAVSLAVAAIPEGLPAIVTMTLALGVLRMVDRHALIRRLPAVETLGSATVICTDKTGTLTKNEMTVVRLWIDGRDFVVTGSGYDPRGEIHEADGDGAATARPGLPAAVRTLLSAATLCNGAELHRNGHWHPVGDPTEAALLVAAAKLGLLKEQLVADHPFVSEVPFDAERKMMTVVRRDGHDGSRTAYVKGAVDVLLSRCTTAITAEGAVVPFDERRKASVLSQNHAFAGDALRVLAIASRPLRQQADPERDLIFLGLAAMRDPARPEARTAIETCRGAGILTVMITGDHKDTAVAVARELVLRPGSWDAISGSELDRLTDEQLAARVDGIAVYARVSAEHKLRIVKAWKARGAVVAMTGDGVNDAPAVKEADIGIAMGLSGTDVTKSAADLVITDDNFASIAAAVEEGRVIYANIQRAIHFLLSCNLSELLVMLLAAAFALPLPLLPVQILWINLVTDGLPALALAMEQGHGGVMRQPPRPLNEQLLTGRRLARYSVEGMLMAAVTIGVFWLAVADRRHTVDTARTLTFTVLVFVQLVHALNCRSSTRSVMELGLLTNSRLMIAIAASALLQITILTWPPLQAIFKATPLNGQEWLLVIAAGLVPLPAMELWKAVRRRWRKV
jgi:Ca2+-transporting ATPase